jgi:hypothetical protein
VLITGRERRTGSSSGWKGSDRQVQSTQTVAGQLLDAIQAMNIDEMIGEAGGLRFPVGFALIYHLFECTDRRCLKRAVRTLQNVT